MLRRDNQSNYILSMFTYYHFPCAFNPSPHFHLSMLSMLSILSISSDMLRILTIPVVVAELRNSSRLRGQLNMVHQRRAERQRPSPRIGSQASHLVADLVEERLVSVCVCVFVGEIRAGCCRLLFVRGGGFKIAGGLAHSINRPFIHTCNYLQYSTCTYTCSDVYNQSTTCIFFWLIVV